MLKDVDVLTPPIVESVFRSCLFKDGESTDNHIVAEGIVQTVGFHPGRIEDYRPAIHGLLAELPDNFKTSGGGGNSFLNACIDKHGNQWTGMHQTVEQLVLLGIAIDEVEFCLPRDMWRTLPGSMPYFMIIQ